MPPHVPHEHIVETSDPYEDDDDEYHYWNSDFYLEDLSDYLEKRDDEEEENGEG